MQEQVHSAVDQETLRKEIEDRIQSALCNFPGINTSMLQTALGSRYTAASWKPVFMDMQRAGKVLVLEVPPLPGLTSRTFVTKIFHIDNALGVRQVVNRCANHGVVISDPYGAIQKFIEQDPSKPEGIDVSEAIEKGVIAQ